MGGKVARLDSLAVDGGRGSVPVTPRPGQQAPAGGVGDASSGLVCQPRVSSEFCGLRVQSPGRPLEPRVGGRGVAGSVWGGGSLLMSESILAAGAHDTASAVSTPVLRLKGDIHTLTPEGGGSRSLTRHCVSVIK